MRCLTLNRRLNTHRFLHLRWWVWGEHKTQTHGLLPLIWWWYKMYCTHIWYLNIEHKTQTQRLLLLWWWFGMNTRFKLMDYYPSDDGMRCTVHTYDTSTQDSNSEIITPQMMVCTVHTYDTWTQDSNSEIITPQIMVCTEHTYDTWTLSTRLTDREYLRQELLWTGVVLCTEYFVAGASAVPDGPGCPGNCFSKGNLFHCCGFSVKWLRETILDQLELFDSV